MSNPAGASFMKFLGYLALGALSIWAVIWVLKLAVALVVQIALPVAIIGGVGYIIYRAIRKKSLPGGSSKPLP